MEIGSCTQFTEDNIGSARSTGLVYIEPEGSHKWSALLRATPEQYGKLVALLRETSARAAGIIFAHNNSPDAAVPKDAEAGFCELLDHCVSLDAWCILVLSRAPDDEYQEGKVGMRMTMTHNVIKKVSRWSSMATPRVKDCHTHT